MEERRINEVSAWPVRNELTVLRHLIRLAHRKWGSLDRVPEIELLEAPRGRTRYLTESEIEKLLNACARCRSQHLAAILTLAINTGMRKNEIMGLTWERAELDKDLGFNAHITLYDAKNGEPRGVPLNTGSGRPSGAYGGEELRQICTVFEKAVERAGPIDFGFHDLRHTAASHLAMRGRTLKDTRSVRAQVVQHDAALCSSKPDALAHSRGVPCRFDTRSLPRKLDT